MVALMCVEGVNYYVTVWLTSFATLFILAKIYRKGDPGTYAEQVLAKQGHFSGLQLTQPLFETSGLWAFCNFRGIQSQKSDNRQLGDNGIKFIHLACGTVTQFSH